MTVQLPGEGHDSPATIGSWPLSSSARPGMAVSSLSESGGVGVGDGVGEAGAADRVGKTDGDGKTEGDRVLVACAPLLAAGWPGPELAVSTAAAPIVRAATAPEAISSAVRRERRGADTGDGVGGVASGGRATGAVAGATGAAGGGQPGGRGGVTVAVAGVGVGAAAIAGVATGVGSAEATEIEAGGTGAAAASGTVPAGGAAAPGAEVYACVGGGIHQVRDSSSRVVACTGWSGRRPRYHSRLSAVGRSAGSLARAAATTWSNGSGTELMSGLRAGPGTGGLRPGQSRKALARWPRTQRSGPRRICRSQARNPRELLGGNVAWRADHAAGSGESAQVQGLRDAEVDDLRPGRGKEHVRRLQVAVYHVRAVDGRKRLGQPGRQAAQPPRVKRPRSLHVLRQRRPLAYSVTRKGRADSVSDSITRTVQTPWTRPRASTSRRNLARKPWLSANRAVAP